MEEKNVVIYFSEQLDNAQTVGTQSTLPTAQRSIPLTKGMSLYRALQKEGITLSAPCAGNGTCGACKVKVIEGNLPVTEKDKQLLSEEQLKEGWRLACQGKVEDSCAIYVPSEQFTAVTGYDERAAANSSNRECDHLVTEQLQGNSLQNNTYSIAIDLGTTTIAYELFSIKTGAIIKTLSATNPQRLYGADVVSRMDQSDNGRKDMLKNILRQGMRKDITALIADMEIEKIRSIGISGNTAMVHLFMGYSCEGLGKYPFMPETLDCIQTNALALNLMDETIPVLITGGISAYVGGDILAGLASKKFLSEKKVSLFIDLGTNAEMALTDGCGKIYVTSAPAGPAFEAANISCGVGSIEGAVSSICIQNGEQKLTTIGKKEPVGFCGSGILEAVYELLKNDLIDETGLLTDDYFEKGYQVKNLKITQQDIRQIQLAKSAVFSAIHILMKKAGVTSDQVDHVYLAGGFGYHLNVEKAIGIALLPKAFEGKVKTVGNTSLHGTKELLRGRITKEELWEIKDVSEEIYLSNETDFQSIFMENMNFKKADRE